MKTSNNTARNIAIIAISIVVATGCGEPPIDDVGPNTYLGQETGAQAQPAPQGTFTIPDEEIRPNLDGIRIETAPVFEALPIENGHVPDPGFDIIENIEDEIDTEQEVLEEEGLEEELEEVEVASIEDGFRDGDATAQEWKDLARATCRIDESELNAFTVVGEREESLYRGARFACIDDSDASQGVIEGKYLAVVLGGESTCKPYNTFEETVRTICGSEADIRTKKVFNTCSESGSERMYESALFVCQIF